MSSSSVLPDEPKGWRKLWEKAQRERDPEKLAALIDRLNQLLSEHEKAAQQERKPPGHSVRECPEH
jgi:hypothetical protein